MSPQNIRKPDPIRVRKPDPIRPRTAFINAYSYYNTARITTATVLCHTHAREAAKTPIIFLTLSGLGERSSVMVAMGNDDGRW